MQLSQYSATPFGKERPINNATAGGIKVANDISPKNFDTRKAACEKKRVRVRGEKVQAYHFGEKPAPKEC